MRGLAARSAERNLTLPRDSGLTTDTTSAHTAPVGVSSVAKGPAAKMCRSGAAVSASELRIVSMAWYLGPGATCFQYAKSTPRSG
jgi:hypothetical protein